MSRSITKSKKALKGQCYIRSRKPWAGEGLDSSTKELLPLCIYNELLFSHVTITMQAKIYKSTCNQCKENAACCIVPVNGSSMRTGKKFFLCQQCNKTLCSNCETTFCVVKLVEFLEDVRKVEKSPDLLKMLNAIVVLNSSDHDVVRTLIHIH